MTPVIGTVSGAVLDYIKREKHLKELITRRIP